MKQKLLLFACTFLSTMLFSQSEQKAFLDWSTTAGSQNFFYKNITKTDAFGNVYVAGATIDSLGATDLLLAKYNSSGVQLWIKQYGTPGYHDFAGGLYVTDNYAYVTGAVTTNTTYLTTDLLTIVYTASGTVQWSATYDGGNNLHEAGKDIRADVSGNVYVTGGGYNASLNTDFLTIKYNSSGSQQWVNAYNYTSSLDDAAYKISLSGSNVLVSGAVTQSANNYKYNTITLTQSSGSLTAVNTSSATTTNSVDVVSDLVIDGSGNAYLAGATNVSGQGYDYYILKMATSNLTTQWQTTWNGSDNLDDVARAIQVDASGNVYVTGYSTTSAQGRDMVTKKYNSSGTLQWTETYNSAVNGDDEGADMIIDASGYIYITGYTASEINQKDYYTIKYNSSGIKIWDIQNDANHTNDAATNMTLDSLNNVIVTGYTETGVGTYKYYTARFVQKDVITPTDYNGESPASNFMYYANKGQIVDTAYAAVSNVKFYTQNTSPSFYIKKNSMSMVFSRIDTVVATADTLHRIDVTFDGAKSAAKTYAMEEQKNGYLNYFLGYLDSAGITGVFGNKYLVTPDLYTNIDLMYSSNQNGIKYYFIVKPGGNPADIAMTFTGATSYSLNGTTNALTINSSIGSLTYDRPVAYQLTSGNATLAVTGWTPDWQTNGASNKYKFNTGSYTSSLTLVIEVDQGNGTTSSSAINNLIWSTFYGGSSDDVFLDVKTNSSNNVWVTGYTGSSNFPTSVGAYQGNNAGNYDAVFVKFNNTGGRIWATLIGGTDNETDYHINGIEVDNNGNSFSAFRTASTNFPTFASIISGAYYDNTNSTSPALAIVSFDNNGTRTWSTYFGGNGDNMTSYDIGLDNNKNLFVSGTGGGIPIMTPSGSYSSPYSFTSGCFIAKFDQNHSLKWSSYIGGGQQYIEKIGITANNDIILVGEVGNDIPFGGGLSSAAQFDLLNPGTGEYYDGSFNGGAYDGIIMRFNGSNNSLHWSTFYGGNDNDYIHATILDNSDNFYISGNTISNASFISGNSFGFNSTTFGGIGFYFGSQTIGDGFLSKFNSTNQFVSNTYFGGAANEGSFDLTFKNNRLFAPFVSAGDDMPFYGSNPSTAFVQSHNSDGQDVSNDGYITAMDDNFNLQWTSYFGGTSSGSASTKDDQIFSNIATGDNKYYIVGGSTSNTGFPQVSGSGYTQSKTSSLDAFIAQFDIATSLVGIKELKNGSNNDLFIYPNPTNSYLNIQYKSNSKYNVEIYNIIGQQVFEKQNINSNFISVDISHLAKGPYVIKVIEKTKLATQKLIID